MQGGIIFVVGVRLNGCYYYVVVDKAAQVVDVAVGVVAHDAVAEPDDVVDAIVCPQVALNLVAVQGRIAVGIEKAGGCRQQVTASVDVD